MLRLLIPALSFTFIGTAAMAEPPRVAADVLPIHSLVAQVMAGIGQPELIVPAGASPHDHALRPSEARTIARADVIIWGGETLSPWLVKGQSTLAGDAVTVDLNALPRTTLHQNRTDHHHDDDGDGGDHHGHDPHSWLDPSNGKLWLAEIAKVLAKTDPKNAATYHTNAILGADRIDLVLGSMSVPGTAQMAVYHDAYQYFEAAFGLPEPLIISESDASPPGAAHVVEVREVLATGAYACLLAEPGYSPQLARRLAEGTETRIVLLDPLGSEFTPGPDLYPALLAHMGEQFMACAG